MYKINFWLTDLADQAQLAGALIKNGYCIETDACGEVNVIVADRAVHDIGPGTLEERMPRKVPKGFLISRDEVLGIIEPVAAHWREHAEEVRPDDVKEIIAGQCELFAALIKNLPAKADDEGGDED